MNVKKLQLLAPAENWVALRISFRYGHMLHTVVVLVKHKHEGTAYKCWIVFS
jgi:hypothetical protein